MKLIEWIPKIGTMKCNPEFNYLGERKYFYKFCPQCFVVENFEHEFVSDNGRYGWKIINNTHECEDL